MQADRQLTSETVVGTVEEKEVRENEWGTYPVLTLKLNDGRRVQIFGFDTVLSNRLAELDPKIGERIGIAYLGISESKTPGRKGYHNYRVIAEGAAREVSFRGLTATEESTGPSVTDDLGGGRSFTEPDLSEPQADEY